MRIAKIDENNLVVQVTVAESEQYGVAWLEENLGGVWVAETGPNTPNLGFTYDPDREAFIPRKDFESWVLDEDTCLWVAPVPMPEETDADGEPVQYTWDEDAGDWVAANV